VTTTKAALLEDVMWRGGLRDDARAELALDTVVEALATLLAPADARFVAAGLPEAYATKIATPLPPPLPTPQDLYERIAASEHVTVGLAVEHAHAACEALADSWDAEQRMLVARRLPTEWAALFEPVDRAPAADTPRGRLPGHGHTLATGRPGSQRSLSGAHPPGAQSQSVASADNPHEDGKLSSATEAADGEQLGSKRPGADEPIAEARDERRGR
jgi:uncharacterized protein (DUF2267 family)